MSDGEHTVSHATLRELLAERDRYRHEARWQRERAERAERRLDELERRHDYSGELSESIRQANRGT